MIKYIKKEIKSFIKNPQFAELGVYTFLFSLILIQLQLHPVICIISPLGYFCLLACGDWMREWFFRIKYYKLRNIIDVIVLNKYKQDSNTVYKLYTRVSINKLESSKDTLETYFNTNILEFKQGKQKRIVYLITNYSSNNYKNLIKITTIDQQIKYACLLQKVNIKNIKIRVNKYKTDIFFNSANQKKEIEKNLSEIEHLIKQRIQLVETKDYDFCFRIIKEVKTLSFFETLKNTNFEPYQFMVGQNLEGDFTILDVRKIYHTIIAGSTGYGKSNLSHVIISTLLKSLSSVEVKPRLILLDPKKSELKRYRRFKFVNYTGDKESILTILKDVEKEMHYRNTLFDQNDFVNNLETWNNTYNNKKLDYIIVYIEEIADLMLSEYAQEFTTIIQSLSQLGRSAGIRLFLTTQKPNKEVIDTKIKANCINRISFAVANSIESRVILDNTNATQLSKPGECFLQYNNTDIYLKVPYLEDKHIIQDIEYLTKISVRGQVKTPYIDENKSHGLECSTPVIPAVEIVRTPAVREINSALDLYNLYNECGYQSIANTVKMTNIGRTKVTQYRKELKQKNML